MARVCEQCGRGTVIGKNVSHAKNRTKRFFRPNLQSLKVVKHGATLRVVFCARCIQRIKKYGNIGMYKHFSYSAVTAPLVVAQTPESHKHIDRDAKKIEEIMKKEESKWKEKAAEEKVSESKKKEEKIRLDELVGKK